jgi:hypothetical protein
LEDLVHTLGAKSGLDEVGNGHTTKEGRKASKFTLLLMSTILLFKDFRNNTL